MVDTDVILDWQQRGIDDRAQGLSWRQNPLLNEHPKSPHGFLEEWQQKFDAWMFGWEIEDAMRR